MTIQQLKYIVTIADKGKISDAATELFITQPSLTNSVHDIEDELGFSIFNRTNRGIALTDDGKRFLSYARQVVEQMSLLENTFLDGTVQKQHFQISAQHYSFVVNAFVDLLEECAFEEYDVTLRECRTYEIIEDVKNARSQIGIIYLSQFNKKILKKYLADNHLEFNALFEAEPHVFIHKEHILAQKEMIGLEDLKDYPCLSFEQGENNSFYFSEEILSTTSTKKAIRVSDRATLFNLLIGMKGYTISTGIISEELNGESIVARKLDVDEHITVGYIKRKGETTTAITSRYLELLKKHTTGVQSEL
ncbi:MAG: LysR family transcriptional regulator [Lachnospiraceae bacterium]|nr:LysR family transcriptional regulator [Lachnospiraceae bacterium]